MSPYRTLGSVRPIEREDGRWEPSVKYARRTFVITAGRQSENPQGIFAEGLGEYPAKITEWEIESITPCPDVGWLVILRKEVTT